MDADARHVLPQEEDRALCSKEVRAAHLEAKVFDTKQCFFDGICAEVDEVNQLSRQDTNVKGLIWGALRCFRFGKLGRWFMHVQNMVDPRVQIVIRCDIRENAVSE